MAGLPPISVRHPQPHDIVDVPVCISGLATGFEGVIAARIRDSNGNQLAEQSIHAGGTGIWGNFHVELALDVEPEGPHGTLEVFEESAKDGQPINTVVVPIVFGYTLVHETYHGFAQYTVQPGDTLSKIAQEFYGSATLWPRIYEANRYQIANPDLIFVGQVLRVPQ